MIHHQTPDNTYDGMAALRITVSSSTANTGTVSVRQIVPSQRDDDTPEPVSNRVTFALLAAGCVALGGLICAAVRFLC